MIPPFPIPIPAGGVRADLDQQNVPAGSCIDARNWIFRDGFMQTRLGLTPDGNSVDGRIMAYTRYEHNDGSPRTVKGTEHGWFLRNSASVWQNITGIPLTAGRFDNQIFRTFDRGGQIYLLGTNGKDTPKKWDGVGPSYLEMGGSPPIAKAMGVIADRIMLGNLVSGGTISTKAIDVSANKDFDTGWGAVQVAILADTNGGIVAIDEIGNLLGAIWKTDALYFAIAQGATDPFRFEMKQKLSTDSGLPAGPCSPNAILTLKDGRRIYLGLDSAGHEFNGGAVKDMHPKIQQYVLAAADRGLLELAHGFYDNERNEAIFIFCSKGSSEPDIGIVLDLNNTANVWPLGWIKNRITAVGMATRSIAIEELGGTFEEQPDSFDAYGNVNSKQLLFGSNTGQSYREQGTADSRYLAIEDLVGTFDEQVGTFDDYGTLSTDPITGYFESGLSVLKGTPRQYKTVHGVEHFFEKADAAETVTVKLGVSNFGEKRVLTNGKTINVGNKGPYRTGFRKDARRISLRYESSSTNKLLYRGAEAEVTPRSTR